MANMNKVEEFLEKHAYTACFGLQTEKQMCCARFPERVDELRRQRIVSTYALDYDAWEIVHTICVGDKIKKGVFCLPRHLMRLYVHFNFQMTCNTFMKYNFYHVKYHVDDKPSDYFGLYKQILPTFPMIEDLEREQPLLECVNQRIPILPPVAEAAIDDDNLKPDYHMLQMALVGAYQAMEILNNE
jgi:hypothetical protein